MYLSELNQRHVLSENRMKDSKMKVYAIENNDKRRSCIIPMAQGAVIGGIAGTVLKYHPLTPDEKNNPEYKKVIDKINKQKTEFNPKTAEFLSNIKAKPQKSLAEDVFVKMFDGIKEGEKVKPAKIRDAIKTIQKKNPAEVNEFKHLCKESIKVAEQTAKKCIDAYNLVTKHIRPTSFYLITGAVVGAFIELFRNILKTEVKH